MPNSNSEKPTCSKMKLAMMAHPHYPNEITEQEYDELMKFKQATKPTTKIKIFKEYGIEKLEKAANDFLETLQKKPLSIQFETEDAYTKVYIVYETTKNQPTN